MTTAQPTFGPGELYVVAFPQERIPETVWAPVADAVRHGVITLLDLTVIRRRADGGLQIVEIEELGDEIDVTVVEAVATGLVGEDDLAEVTAGLEPGTSALVLLLEHTWARTIAAAVREAGAVVLATERFPSDVMNEVGAIAGVPSPADTRSSART